MILRLNCYDFTQMEFLKLHDYDINTQSPPPHTHTVFLSHVTEGNWVGGLLRREAHGLMTNSWTKPPFSAN